jgi:hypothetical protein
MGQQLLGYNAAVMLLAMRLARLVLLQRLLNALNAACSNACNLLDKHNTAAVNCMYHCWGSAAACTGAPTAYALYVRFDHSGRVPNLSFNALLAQVHTYAARWAYHGEGYQPVYYGNEYVR